MKRTLAFAIAALMLLSLACGCTSGADTPSASASPSASTPASQDPAPSDAGGDPAQPAGDDEFGGYTVPLFEESYTFSILVPDAPFLYTVIENMDMIDELCGSTVTMEELTNVHLDFTRVSDIVTTLPIVVASNDYPDMFWQCLSYWAGGVGRAADDGVVMVLTDYMDQLPHYQALLDEDEQLRRGATFITGDIISLYTIKTDYDLQNQGALVRGDWAAEVGMGQEDFKTYDDMYDFLKAVNVTHGGILYPTKYIFDNWLAQGYGIRLNCNTGYYPIYQVNGTVKCGYLEASAYDCMKMYSDWYAEGLITPEFLAQESDRQADRAIILNQAAAIHVGAGQIDEYYALADDPSYELLPISYPSLDGESKQKLYLLETRMADSLEISTQVENLDVLLKWIDFGYTDYPSTVWTYGTEGLHWDYDASGQPQFHDIVVNNPIFENVMFATGLYCSSAAGPHTQYTFFMNSTYSDLRLGASEYWDEHCEKDNHYIMPSKLTVLSEDTTRFSELWSECSTYISENIGTFLIHGLTQEQWDAFIVQLKILGMEEIVEMWQRALDAYNNL